MKSTLSIDIGSKNLHIAEGLNVKGKLNISQMECFEIPKGCLNGERVENVELLSESIKDAIKKANFNFSDVIFTFNACNAVVRDIDLPPAKPKETESMVKSELVQTFNILPEDIIQFKEIEKVEGANGEKLNRYRATVIAKIVLTHIMN